MKTLKIWYKDIDPTTPISIGKSSGRVGESHFDVDSMTIQEFDHEFYNISPGPPKTLARKPQTMIDAIITARETAAVKTILKEGLEQTITCQQMSSRRLWIGSNGLT